MSLVGRIRFICPNESCINKSIVFRKPGTVNVCKACDSTLIRVQNNKDVKQDEKAKRELRILGNV